MAPGARRRNAGDRLACRRHWGRLCPQAAESEASYGLGNLDARAIVLWTTIQNRAPAGNLMVRLGTQRRPDLDFHCFMAIRPNPVGAMIVYMLERPR